MNWTDGMSKEDLVGMYQRQHGQFMKLSQKDAKFRNKWRRIKGQPRFTWKMVTEKGVCILHKIH